MALPSCFDDFEVHGLGSAAARYMCSFFPGHDWTEIRGEYQEFAGQLRHHSFNFGNSVRTSLGLTLLVDSTRTHRNDDRTR